MVPFVERNYNLVELGPRGTGKCHLFQQVSPYAHLISGGKATVAKMFVNNATGQRGLVCQYDVVCFDEVSGISFDQKDGVNIMKGYMESGEFSRGKESIRADGGIVMVGNFDVDVEQQQRIGHLLGPLPPEMRNDTAFMDRIHAYLPGWDFPKLNPTDHFTDHFGLVSDFLTECWSQLRTGNRVARAAGPGAPRRRAERPRHRGRQQDGQRPPSCCSPTPTMPVSDEDLEWMVRLALEVAAAGEGAAEARASRASSATRTSATRSGRTASSSSCRRPSCTATRRSRAIRCRPARSGRSARAARRPAPGSTASRSPAGPAAASRS